MTSYSTSQPKKKKKKKGELNPSLLVSVAGRAGGRKEKKGRSCLAATRTPAEGEQREGGKVMGRVIFIFYSFSAPRTGEGRKKGPSCILSEGKKGRGTGTLTSSS